MKPEDEERFRGLFLTEATEQLDRLADTMLQLERAGGGAELVATVFRDAHTLKSSAALVGLDEVSGVAHGLEDLLGELRAGTRAVTPGLVDGVLEVVDALRALVGSGLAGTADPGHAARALAALARAGAVEPVPQAAASYEAATFRQLFADEVVPQLVRLSRTALELEHRGPEPELVDALFRGAHSLKGSAAVVGFHAVSALAEGLEARLDELRHGRREASPAFVDAILAVLGAVRAATPALVAGKAAGALLEPAEAALARLAAEDAAGGGGAAGTARAPEPATEEPVPAPEGPERPADAAGQPGTAAPPAEAPRGAPTPLAPAIVRPPALPSSRPEPVQPEPLAPAIVRPPPLAPAARSGAPGAGGPPREGRSGRGATPSARSAPPAAPAEAPEVSAPTSAGEVHARDDVPGEPAHGESARDIGEPALAREPDAPPSPPEVPASVVEPEAPLPPPEVAPPPAPEDPPPAPAPARPEDRLVPVALGRLDRLVRLSGEAVAAQLRLAHLLREHIAGDPIAEAAEVQLRRVLGDVQEQTMRTRMTSFEGIAGNLRRAARDVARATGKEVECTVGGERVELDRAVLDGLRDPLLHLVRNAVDHGIEPPAGREAAGKPRCGSVRVSAERRGPEVVVTVADDGAGLDLDRLRERAGQPGLDDHDAALVSFRPGLSTAEVVTGISGRGVGLDAVRTAVQALRGRVDVASSPGAGARFTVTVPLTLAVVPCVLVEAAGERYHLPTHATVTIAGDDPGEEVGLEGGRALWVGSGVVPLSTLAGALGRGTSTATGPALVLEGSGGVRHAFRVDAVLGQRDVTVKELGAVVPRTQLVAGASVEPDGSVVLVIDATALVETGSRRREPLPPPEAAAAAGPAATVLVVDDALTVRELQRSILERAGYAVQVAGNGQEALARLAEARPDLVVTDIEMPLLDGYELARAIRRTPALQSLPVLMLTSRDDGEDRLRGLEAGADAYLVKREFDAARLLDAVRRLLGA